MNRYLKLFLILTTSAFAVARLFGVRGDVFKDFAHVWAGALLAAWFACWRLGKLIGELPIDGDIFGNIKMLKQLRISIINILATASESKRTTGILFLVVCAAELLAAFVLYPMVR